MRQIVLDTETTGLDPQQGHRIIEIGCVELVERRYTGNNYHIYINPEREIDAGAMEVHGITNEMLSTKPRFSEIVSDFVDYIRDSELLIHNASFDTAFLDAELTRDDKNAPCVSELCSVLDTLAMAREMHPGQRNSLDALCRRYEVDNTQRSLHGALLDARLLAEVYLAMTGGQTAMSLDSGQGGPDHALQGVDQRLSALGKRPPVISASDEELLAHRERLQAIAQACGNALVWSAGPAVDVE